MSIRVHAHAGAGIERHADCFGKIPAAVGKKDDLVASISAFLPGLENENILDACDRESEANLQLRRLLSLTFTADVSGGREYR